ncbi:MAG TPA: DUF488 domain-containing protein [Acidobacteriaceae bacterium]|jgi:uncharacterized protein YeaO (DUF488 family)
MTIRIKRVYEPAADADGRRILVDRLWPRGLSKANAHVDVWLKDAGPSHALRKWFGHDPDRWAEFQRKYRAELKGSAALQELKKAAKGNVTLLYGAKDEEHNQAVVLLRILKR